MEYKFVNGVINALGFENVLKVDFSPKKTCNFDCIYCSVGRTTTWLNERKEFFSVKDILFEIDHYMSNNNGINYMMLTGSGEPALYKEFGALVSEIKKKYPKVKIMAYTNGTMLKRADVESEFLSCDILGVNLNSVIKDEFSTICRPMNTINLKNILDGLLEFKKKFKGILFVDSKIIANINDTENSLDGLLTYIEKLKPDKYAIIVRKFKGQIPNEEFIEIAKEGLSKLSIKTNFFS